MLVEERPTLVLQLVERADGTEDGHQLGAVEAAVAAVEESVGNVEAVLRVGVGDDELYRLRAGRQARQHEAVAAFAADRVTAAGAADDGVVAVATVDLDVVAERALPGMRRDETRVDVIVASAALDTAQLGAGVDAICIRRAGQPLDRLEPNAAVAARRRRLHEMPGVVAGVDDEAAGCLLEREFVAVSVRIFVAEIDRYLHVQQFHALAEEDAVVLVAPAHAIDGEQPGGALVVRGLEVRHEMRSCACFALDQHLAGTDEIERVAAVLVVGHRIVAAMGEVDTRRPANDVVVAAAVHAVDDALCAATGELVVPPTAKQSVELQLDTHVVVTDRAEQRGVSGRPADSVGEVLREVVARAEQHRCDEAGRVQRRDGIEGRAEGRVDELGVVDFGGVRGHSAPVDIRVGRGEQATAAHVRRADFGLECSTAHAAVGEPERQRAAVAEYAEHVSCGASHHRALDHVPFFLRHGDAGQAVGNVHELEMIEPEEAEVLDLDGQGFDVDGRHGVSPNGAMATAPRWAGAARQCRGKDCSAQEPRTLAHGSIPSSSRSFGARHLFDAGSNGAARRYGIQVPLRKPPVSALPPGWIVGRLYAQCPYPLEM